MPPPKKRNRKQSRKRVKKETNEEREAKFYTKGKEVELTADLKDELGVVTAVSYKKATKEEKKAARIKEETKEMFVKMSSKKRKKLAEIAVRLLHKATPAGPFPIIASDQGHLPPYCLLCIYRRRNKRKRSVESS